MNFDNSKILRHMGGNRHGHSGTVWALLLCNNNVIACSDLSNVLDHCLKEYASKLSYCT